jgi:hypothetical protein
MLIKYCRNHCLHFFLLVILFFIFMSPPVSGQNDSNMVKFGRHIISLHETSDFALSQYGKGVTHSGNYPYKYGYYHQYPINSLQGVYSFSVGISYEYVTGKNTSVFGGLYFSREGFGLSNTNPIGYEGRGYSQFYYYVSYIDLPLGYKFIFLNKRKVSPYIACGLINGFLINENADLIDNLSQSFIHINSSTFRYYFLKPEINIGCDVKIKKRFRIGAEVDWKGYAFYHTNKTLPYRFKYTNLNFGVSFGYFIK